MGHTDPSGGRPGSAIERTQRVQQGVNGGPTTGFTVPEVIIGTLCDAARGPPGSPERQVGAPSSAGRVNATRPAAPSCPPGAPRARLLCTPSARPTTPRTPGAPAVSSGLRDARKDPAGAPALSERRRWSPQACRSDADATTRGPNPRPVGRMLASPSPPEPVETSEARRSARSCPRRGENAPLDDRSAIESHEPALAWARTRHSTPCPSSVTLWLPGQPQRDARRLGDSATRRLGHSTPVPVPVPVECHVMAAKGTTT
ncbi:hypothetical protein JOF36_004368 [Pseudonocardia parietis]|uniref:Uncharacterized protein n=1 Tax=Pseudonocardia parietis TaxID=570936 RepID=A0ABS4VXM9_9PSEU|nr:hypothetical protein [Pseudonocardia parietis]